MSQVEEKEAAPKRRTRRPPGEDGKGKQNKQKKDQAGDKTEIVWYEAESWEDTKEGVRRLMRTIESRMSELEGKMKRLLRKYDECARLKRMVQPQNE